MGNKKSFYHHMNNKTINNEKVHQLLNKSGDSLTADADKALTSPVRSCSPLYLRSSRRRETTSTGRVLSQGSLKKSQLTEAPGELDGIFRKMLRDCLMTLQGHSLIFQKLWISGKVSSDWTKANTTPSFKKRQGWPGELHISPSHFFPGKIMEQIHLEAISRHKKKKVAEESSMGSPRINHAWSIWLPPVMKWLSLWRTEEQWTSLTLARLLT